MKSRRRIAAGTILSALVLAAWAYWWFTFRQPPEPPIDPNAPPEYTVQVIEMEGEVAATRAELSGLAWYEDTLILLPQYPQKVSKQGGSRLYAIPRQALLEAIDAQVTIKPIPVPLYAEEIYTAVPGFEGFEAIAFIGNQVYLTIEARQGLLNMDGYLVSGQIAPDLSAIYLDANSLTKNSPQIRLHNKSDEALLVVDNQIITFFEINGAALNSSPHATLFDHQLKRLNTLPFPALEYRVTDASAMDDNQHFWVINDFYPLEINLRPETDALFEHYGKGASHAQFPSVERLVEMQYSPEGITLTSTPPIQLKLLSNGDARNWEGIAVLDGLGFVLVTDKYPESILGFVPFP